MWSLAARKGAKRVLMGVSLTESIFFPVPPDLMLIPMALAKREEAYRLAFICLVFSLVGGIAGYIIGYFFMEVAGWPIIRFYGLEEQYILIQEYYSRYSAWAVAIAGLTPIPYKVCTLTAGAFKIDFLIFLVASTLSRGLRFFVIAALISRFGERTRLFLHKRFDVLLVGTVVLVVFGFLILRLI
jgi:membrane protein YqaA with SNARE-associated domain